MAFRDSFKVSRQKLEFYYSIAVIIIIPVLIVINTLILTQTVRSNFDIELGRKADLANSIIGAAFAQQTDDSQAIQSIIDKISVERPEINRLYVLTPTQSTGDFEVIAAKDAETVGQIFSSQKIISLGLVSSSKQAISTAVETDEGNRAWSVTSPIISGDDVVAIVSMDLSLSGADALISSLLTKSLFILMAVVTVVILLLLNHFKFVEYAMLFKKMEEVDQLKNDFLSVATHELKAPMAVIKGSIENVLDGVVGTVDEKARVSLQSAFNETDRLANLVADLLNVSRIEQGRVSYNFEAVDVSEVVTRVVRQYRQKARDKGLNLQYQEPEEAFFISVDRGRFLEIMTNLIDNAVKYSRRGDITVFHKVEKDFIKTVVRDTGVGMSAKEREHLFQRFYRIRNDKTKDIGGTGLGLWIIKQYIEAMKGHIYVDSLEGVGSEFTVEFPLTARRELTSKTYTPDKQ